MAPCGAPLANPESHIQHQPKVRCTALHRATDRSGGLWQRVGGVASAAAKGWTKKAWGFPTHLDLAQHQHDLALLMRAHNRPGQILHNGGAFASARTCLEQGFALFDSRGHPTLHTAPGWMHDCTLCLHEVS
jgi:hypothetical protein